MLTGTTPVRTRGRQPSKLRDQRSYPLEDRQKSARLKANSEGGSMCLCLHTIKYALGLYLYRKCTNREPPPEVKAWLAQL